MLQSSARRHSGVVTKWIPLFNVQVMIVGSRGTGTCIPFKPRTGNHLSIRLLMLEEESTSDEHLAVRLARLVFGAQLLDLPRVLVLPNIASMRTPRISYRARTHHVRRPLHSAPGLASVNVTSIAHVGDLFCVRAGIDRLFVLSDVIFLFIRKPSVQQTLKK